MRREVTEALCGETLGRSSANNRAIDNMRGTGGPQEPMRTTPGYRAANTDTPPLTKPLAAQLGHPAGAVADE